MEVMIGGVRYMLFGEVDSLGRCDAMELDAMGQFTGRSIRVNIFCL